MQAPYKRPLLLVTLLFSFFSSIQGQSDQAKALQKLYDEYPQEKIYTWFNKPEYIAGETIWFKIYIFSGYDLANISHNVYVELYNTDRRLITSRLLPLFSGTGQGSIELDDKLPEGVYYIRAYTRWMLNFDEKFQYIHPLPVINPSSSSKLLQKKQLWTAAVFPEGGSLIAGINTKVAVRLFSSAILPDDWSGYVFEEGNSISRVAAFNSLDNNVALFSFMPAAGKKYYATITDRTGNKQIITLPEVKKTGVGIQVENQDDSIICRIHFKNIQEGGHTYTLIGQIQHQMVFHARFKKRDAEMKIPIPTGDMYNGILHLTIFDDTKTALAERLVFVHPQKLFIDSSVIGNYNFYNEPRVENDLEIIIDSLNWGSYGLSIMDAAAPAITSQENLISALLLNSDLTTPLRDAAKYFTSQNEKTAEAIDALLITENWKRFKWEQILNGIYPVIKYLPHSYLSYTATVKRNKKLQSLEEINLMLYFPDSSTHFLMAKTDSTGSFTLDNFAFEGELKVYYQKNNKKPTAKNIDISIERNNKFFSYSLPFPESHYLLAPRISQDSFPAWVNNSINQQKNEKQANNQYKTLQEVIVRSKLKTAKEQLIEKLGSNRFSSFNEIIFDFINEEQNAIAYSNILQWLEGRVAGLSIELQNGTYVPYIRGSVASIFLDEMPYPADGLNSLSVSDIAMIKVIKGPMAFAFGDGGGGSIIIYTARGDLRPAQREPSLNNSVMNGYDAEKKFYIPDYNDKFIKKPEIDTRDQLLLSSLLFPNKSIIESKNRFINNDFSKSFRVIVQGFTEKGFPVYFEKIIEAPTKAF